MCHKCWACTPEAMLHNRRSDHTSAREEPLLTTTREHPRTATKTQQSQIKLKRKKQNKTWKARQTMEIDSLKQLQAMKFRDATGRRDPPCWSDSSLRSFFHPTDTSRSPGMTRRPGVQHRVGFPLWPGFKFRGQKTRILTKELLEAQWRQRFVIWKPQRAAKNTKDSCLEALKGRCSEQDAVYLGCRPALTQQSLDGWRWWTGKEVSQPTSKLLPCPRKQRKRWA